ncbi:hypothetical protein MLD38_001573 [Melastoma candidum]|uniref:Uncharacterized protein n=1 Tax=Melastoma candidum TaxID=119954 RepID=A0ACB9SDP3_9MYRT|nr:hypothetical protein MLD38_001573 [Melastoma candidum]
MEGTSSVLVDQQLPYHKESDQIHRPHKLADHDSGWQTVSYPKRNRKAAPSNPATSKRPSDSLHPNGGSDVFRSIEAYAEERRRKILESRMAAAGSGAVVVTRRGDGDGDEEDSDAEASRGDGAGGAGGEVEKVKQKKPKKPKVTVAEAAARMDAGDLGAFLTDITASYETQQDIQMMRFADYFGRAFASVNAAQFPWVKMFKESTITKLVDIPLTQIREDIHKTSVDWISKRSVEALSSFVLWALDSIMTDLSSHLGSAKGSKKAAQPVSSKSQVAIFLVLAMVLRRKPDALVSLLPTVKDNPKYLGQDKLLVIVWAISQASEGDLAIGLYLWVHTLLPVLSSKSGYNPQSRDLILQLVERILSVPKSRAILVNGAVRKGERLVPPSALDILMRLTFPAAQIKETERLVAIYPTLKEVGLAGPSGSKALKQLALQLSSLAIKGAGEGNPRLASEASDIFLWCLTQNHECYKHWDKIYLDNLEANVVILKKMSNSGFGLDKNSLETLKEILKLFKLKNENALTKLDDPRHALIKESNKYCKVILGRVSGGNSCVKFLVVMSLLALILAVLTQKRDMEKLSAMIVDFAKTA